MIMSSVKAEVLAYYSWLVQHTNLYVLCIAHDMCVLCILMFAIEHIGTFLHIVMRLLYKTC